eukprot:4610911-Pleurochrysis_carterae.AAC.3
MPLRAALSEFMLPCTYPTRSHSATSTACRSHTSSNIFTQRPLNGSVGYCNDRCANSRFCAWRSISMSKSVSSRCQKSSRWPNRKNDVATRIATAPGSTDDVGAPSRSYHWRRTPSPVRTTESARVVGTPSAAMASEAKNSRRADRSTARPSNPREKGLANRDSAPITTLAAIPAREVNAVGGRPALHALGQVSRGKPKEGLTLTVLCA